MEADELVEIAATFRNRLGDEECITLIRERMVISLHDYLDHLGQSTEVTKVDSPYEFNHIFLMLPDGSILDPLADRLGKYPKIYLGEALPIHRTYLARREKKWIPPQG